MPQRVLALCLDAFDAGLCERLVAETGMDGFANFRDASAVYDLQHGARGADGYSGLTWEQFCSGLKPETSGKWSVVSFDPNSYECWQSDAELPPFVAHTGAKVAVFDPPYFTLDKAPNACGIVGWGGHDTGVPRMANPSELLDELDARYAAAPPLGFVNSMVYPSADATRAMAESLAATVDRRTDIMGWLFGERLTDWDIAIGGISETHDGIELLYHGVDPGHRFADLPSTAPARKGLQDIYASVSRCIQNLRQQFPDVALIAFSMHGMGANDTDIATQLLLSELLYRMEFGRPYFRAPAEWRREAYPQLRFGDVWHDRVNAHMSATPLGNMPERALRKAKRVLFGEQDTTVDGSFTPEGSGDVRSSMHWMPSGRYQQFWPQMRAFGVPTYFDGRVRINLKGRERDGLVARENYVEELERIEAVLLACTNTANGAPAVKRIERANEADPYAIPDTEADLKVFWSVDVMGLAHPEYGPIGPAPMRRVGGHSGGYGVMYAHGCDGLEPGRHGLRSSYDVAPTILDLAGVVRPNQLDGRSVADTAGAVTDTPQSCAGVQAANDTGSAQTDAADAPHLDAVSGGR